MEMSFNGDFEVGIPRADTFELLSDPEKFLPVLPMYHSMQKKESDPNTSIVKVKVGIGKVHAIATTEMSLLDNERPSRASYVGKGKVMGGAYNMIVAFQLEDSAGGGTRIDWEGTTQIHGKILSIAGGGLRGIAEKEITKVIGSLRDALVSKQHFESIALAARERPVSVGFIARIVGFIRSLLKAGEVSAASDEPQKTVTPRQEPRPCRAPTPY